MHLFPPLKWRAIFIWGRDITQKGCTEKGKVLKRRGRREVPQRTQRVREGPGKIWRAQVSLLVNGTALSMHLFPPLEVGPIFIWENLL